MLERVRRHPLPSLFLVGCVTCIGVYAYTGYTNLDEIYKTLGFKAESNHLNFILASYVFMTITFLALLIGGRLAEWLTDREVGMKSLLKFSWKWVIAIGLSPIYVLAQVTIDIGYYPILRSVASTCVIMFLITLFISKRRNK
ncbi:hypothetical protein [Bacillus toyonensis]|uniref:hypothetical protein n=1 Tax=Bacillus toyonensis TaxID=155322 RepID=UPI00159BC8F3|nr:hypothetical protein [Bacillus toyonensis]